jgi:hypothetical protein
MVNNSVISLKCAIMSRKNVFKSVLCVVMLGFVLTFSSCQKSEDKKIIGKWEYKKIEVRSLETSNIVMNNAIRAVIPTMFSTVMPMVLGYDFNGITEFTKNSKVIFHGTNAENTADYKVNETKLAITTDDGNSITCDYSIPEKKTMYLDIDAIESFSEMVDAFAEGVSQGSVTDFKITKLVLRLSFDKQK